MAKATPVRRALFGAGVGLVLGALVIFVGLVSVLSGAKPVVQEPTYEQRLQTAFRNMARDEWTSKIKDPNLILARISVNQLRTGDMDTTLTRINEQQIPVDEIRTNAVYDYLNHMVQATEPPRPEVIKTAKEVAMKIQDPLLKADSLRRVGELELRLDPKAAAETFKAAAAAIPNPIVPVPQPSLFNPIMLLWPVGLAIFGFLLVWLMLGVFDSGTGKAVATDEDDDEEEEETPRMAEAPMAEAPMAEAPIVDDVPLADSPAPALAAPMPARPSALSGAVPAGAAPVPGAPDKKTMMARAPQPTMLAKQGQATQLAKQGVPTKLADTTEALPLDDKPVKTATKK